MSAINNFRRSANSKFLNFFFLLFIFLFSSGLLSACPVCRGGISQAEQNAYILTIVILGSLPLLIVGGLFFWIYRKYKVHKNDYRD